MRKIKLAGIISAAMLAAGCVFAAVSPAVFAVEEKGERSVSIPEVFTLYTEMTYDGALVKTEVSDLEGELLKDYVAPISANFCEMNLVSNVMGTPSAVSIPLPASIARVSATRKVTESPWLR